MSVRAARRSEQERSSSERGDQADLLAAGGAGSHHFAAQVTPFFFGGAAPDAGVLIGLKRELQAGFLAWTLVAHHLRRFDLLDCQTGRADRKEQIRRGVSTRRAARASHVPRAFE